MEHPLDVSRASTLDHTRETHGFSPIPASERGLLTLTAQPYFKVSDELIALEGPAFDRHDNLYFVDIYGGRVLRLTPELQLSTVFSDRSVKPVGIAIHRDGRLFVADLGDFRAGRIVAIAPDGSDVQIVMPAEAGFVPDDLVFDHAGGFYLSDFRGTSTSPAGGIVHVSADARTITSVLPGMAAANGVALSPNGRVLWATEFCTSRLHRVELEAPTTVTRYGTSVPYHFVGRAPDSMRVDAEGNVYVAMYQQGRILVFSPNGVPIAQILLPGRDEGRFLKSTSLAFVPGSRDLVIVSRDEVGGGGSMIFKARGFAAGAKLFSHFDAP